MISFFSAALRRIEVLVEEVFFFAVLVEVFLPLEDVEDVFLFEVLAEEVFLPEVLVEDVFLFEVEDAVDVLREEVPVEALVISSSILVFLPFVCISKKQSEKRSDCLNISDQKPK